MEQDEVQLRFGVLGAAIIADVQVARRACAHVLRVAIAAVLNENDHECAASDLVLYRPSYRVRGTAELTTDATRFVRQARLPGCDSQVMTPGQPLSDFFSEGFPASEDEIHVLVQVTLSDCDLRKRSRIGSICALQWHHVDGDLPPLQCEDTDKLLTFPHRYLEGSGVLAPETNAPLVLYRREGLESEWDAIQRCSIDLQAKLYITGAPGCGKSCAAYAFACSRVNRTEWNLVWIHGSQSDDAVFLVWFQDLKKATATVSPVRPWESIQHLLERVEACSIGKKKSTLVFLDGFVGSETWNDGTERAISAWQSEGKSKRRLVCVSSLASMTNWTDQVCGPFLREPSGGHTSIRVKTQFQVPSWTLEEYVKAVRDPRFADAVRGVLDPHHSQSKSAEELVRDKHFFVGASARHMFCYSTTGALETLNRAIDRVIDLKSLLDSGVLLAYYWSSSDGEFRCHVVSIYAARRIAMRVGKSEDLASLVGLDS